MKREVLITRDYLQFNQGERHKLLEEKVGSLLIKDTAGGYYHIPKTHCAILPSTPLVSPVSPDALGQVLGQKPTSEPVKLSRLAPW